MAKVSSIGIGVVVGSDGFNVQGGDTSRTLTVSGGNVELIGTATPYTYTFPSADITVVGTTSSQVLENKTFTDSTTFFQSNSDNSKKIQFDLSNLTNSATRTISFPDSTGTLAVSGSMPTTFTGVAVSGQTTVTAGTNETLTFVAGSNMTITTNNLSKSVIFAAAATDSGAADSTEAIAYSIVFGV